MRPTQVGVAIHAFNAHPEPGYRLPDQVDVQGGDIVDHADDDVAFVVAEVTECDIHGRRIGDTKSQGCNDAPGFNGLMFGLASVPVNTGTRSRR